MKRANLNRGLLLASASAAALLLAGGASPAFAVSCLSTPATGPIVNSLSQPCIAVTHTTVGTPFDFSGGVSNTGAITATTHDGIEVSTVSTFTGGVTNTGATITATIHEGVFVQTVSSYTRGIAYE